MLSFRSLRGGAHLPLLIFLAVSVAMAGCAITGAKSSELSTPTVAVALGQQPPSTLSVGGTAIISATVSNDVADSGVDWVAMCGSAPFCGSFSPSHTASGAPTTFKAPIGVPTGNTVAVTALSTTDHSKASSAKVTILSTVTGVTITQFPPSSYPSGGSLQVAATVAGDSSSAGVNWKATCGTVDCTVGFNGGTGSAPGAPATFTVPLQSVTYPDIVGSTVTLTAFAAADHNFSASTTFTVTGAISISITQRPSGTVLTDASVPVIAEVANDPTSSGVTWTILNCDLSPCGSWSGNPKVLSTQVASGAVATYIAPHTAVGHVNIQAAATASPRTVVAEFQISITAPISTAITQKVLNDTIVRNHTAPLIATVSGDAGNAGVDWTVNCATPGACGSFSPTHTPSAPAGGDATIFTAPGVVPPNATVTITATSTADPTKSASETVTVTAGVPPSSLLVGQWVMSLSGRNANGGPYALGGVIIGDGVGKITGGSLDLVDLGAGAGNASNVPVSATTPSTYSIGPDGRGQIQLTVNTAVLNGNFGVSGSGSIALSVVFVNPKHALVTENDTFGTGTGTLDLQNAADLASLVNGTAGLNGIYSLILRGAEVSGTNPEYIVAGAVGLHSSGNSYTETSYTADQSDNGKITSIAVHQASHGFINAVPNIYGELALDSVNLGLPTLFNLNAWLIDAQHFVVTDWRDSFAGTPNVVVIGYLVAQPSSNPLSGSYAFTVTGETASQTPQAVGGIFTCGSGGSLDVTPLGGTPVGNQAISVACATPANSNNRGLITITGAGTTGISKFAEYPTVDQGLFLIELDGGSTGTSGPSGAGVVRQQTLRTPAISAFSGNYASNFLAKTSQGSEGFAAQINLDGVSKLSGSADVSSFNTSAPPFGAGTPSSNAALSGSFTSGANGRFPLVLKITPAAGQPAPQFSTINPACYVLDADTVTSKVNSCLLLGLDATAPGMGIVELQNTGL